MSSNESVISRSFEMTHLIAVNYFSHVANHYFNDLVNCLASYASSKKDTDLAVSAIKSMKLCAKKLTACTLTFIALLSQTGKPSKAVEAEEEDPVQRWDMQWLSLINAFVKTILNASVDNRRIAANTLFSILKAEGVNYDTQLWKFLFEQGLWHLIDKLKNVTADTKVPVCGA